MRHGGPALLLLLLCLLPARGQLPADRVSAIIVTNVGPAAASEQLVRANIHVKTNDVYNPRMVYDDIPNLYATGLFMNIRIQDRHTPDGWELTYVLRGKPRITSISLEGNARFSNSKLKKKITSKEGAPMDEARLFEDAQEIEKFYEKSGYTHTRVSYEVVNMDEAAGRAGVVFKVEEAPKIRILEIDFVGAHVFTQKQLRGVLKTRSHWMFSWLTGSGVYKDDEFQEDQDRLADHYRQDGYIDFEIKATNISYPAPNRMIIQFVVDEGKQYTVGSVTIKGNQLFTTPQIIAGLKALHDANRSKAKIGEHGLEDDVGMVFKPESLNHDLDAVSDFYGAKGYLDVGTRNGLRVVQIPNTVTGTMDLEYNIEEGQQSRIEKIEIKGNVKTKDKVIRRELLVSPGEVFNMVRVKASQRRLEQMGYFAPDSVKVEPQSDPTLPPDAKNLVITVEEQSTGNMTFGAGYSTVESISGFIQVEQDNFDLGKPPYFIGSGGGQKVLLSIQVGYLIQNYRLNFTEPWLFGRHLRLDTSIYRSVANNLSLDNLYDVSRTGASVGITRALWRDNQTLNLSYNIEQIDINHVNTNAPTPILDDAGSTLVNRFGVGLAYDTRNDTQLPNGGSRNSISTVLTVGSRTYDKTEVSSAWYFKGLAKGHVLEIVGRAGVAQKLSSRDVPFYDRYFLGGEYDLRGFDYTGVGPRAVTQDGDNYEPIGGDTYWMGSAEYSIPIIEHLRFAVFYDIGNVSAKPWNNSGYSVIGKAADPFYPGPGTLYNQFGAGNTGTFSDNYGFGIRIDIPHFGVPLRLDYGIPVHHDQFNSSGGKFQFSAGYSRPL